MLFGDKAIARRNKALRKLIVRLSAVATASSAYKFPHNRPHSMLFSILPSLYLLSSPVPMYPEVGESFFYMLAFPLPALASPSRSPPPSSPLHLSYRDRISPSNFPLVHAESQSNNHLRVLHSYLTRRGSSSYMPPYRRYPQATSFLSSNMPADGDTVR